MDLFDAEILAKHYISEYASGYTFAWNNLKTVYGKCDYSKRVIYLSRKLIPLCSQEDTRKTIFHEICHALTEGDGHGSLWAAKMHEFGYTADRCASYQIDSASISNWRAQCWQCGKIAYMIRRPRRVRSCGPCSGGRYNKAYNLNYIRMEK